MSTVKLKNAFIWNCPECKQQNICFPEPLEMTDYEKIEMAKEAGIDIQDLSCGEIVSNPKKVSCKECLKEFNAG